MPRIIPPQHLNTLKKAIDSVNNSSILVEGVQTSPQACYHIETDPVNVLFNLNCPDILRTAIGGIIEKYAVEISGSQDNTL